MAVGAARVVFDVEIGAGRGTILDLLVIEDDPIIGKTLCKGLSEEGHQCAWAKDGERGLELAAGRQYDAIVLDLMLPGRPGLDVLKELRRQGIHAPVIVLTAMGGVEDRVNGLQAGADDYIVKPFALVELMARLEAVCRRAVNRPPAVMQAGKLTLDLGTRRVTRDGKEIELTPTEFSMMELLMRFAGHVVTRRMLCEHLWETDWEGATNVIEVHINRLRGKLDKGYKESAIQTVRGRGYALRTT
jgi:two-component system OmpR family response regulator/two-component system copper resistance phosphate regulon response regulator CusR